MENQSKIETIHELWNGYFQREDNAQNEELISKKTPVFYVCAYTAKITSKLENWPGTVPREPEEKRDKFKIGILKNLEMFGTLHYLLSVDQKLKEDYFSNPDLRRAMLTSGILFEYVKRSGSTAIYFYYQDYLEDLSEAEFLDLTGKQINFLEFGEAEATDSIKELEYRYDFWPGVGMKIPPYVRVEVDLFRPFPSLRFVTMKTLTEGRIVLGDEIIIHEGWEAIQFNVMGNHYIYYKKPLADNVSANLAELSSNFEKALADLKGIEEIQGNSREHEAFLRESEALILQGAKVGWEKLDSGFFMISKLPNLGQGEQPTWEQSLIRVFNRENYEIILTMPCPIIKYDSLLRTEMLSGDGVYDGEVVLTSSNCTQ